jgi:hypothetical protein
VLDIAKTFNYGFINKVKIIQNLCEGNDTSLSHISVSFVIYIVHKGKKSYIVDVNNALACMCLV